MAGIEYRTLDIPEKQILVYLPNVRAYHWNHRVLHHRIEGSKWITTDPEGVTKVTDLAGHDIKVLARNSEFPEDLIEEARLGSVPLYEGAAHLRPGTSRVS